jgi:hypothetical protein
LEEKIMKTLLLVFAMSAASLFAIDSDDSPAPVPEPASIALMGAGLAGVGFAAWRKNRKK